MADNSDKKPKQGAVTGGWICLLIGSGLMIWTMLSFFIYLPVFLASFVLGIVAIIQHRIGHGVTILLLSIIWPIILGFAIYDYSKYERSVEQPAQYNYNEVPAKSESIPVRETYNHPQSNQLMETVELIDVSNSDNLVKIILQYDKIDPEYSKDFKIARFDINNDGEKDILYTCQWSYGSGGYSWEILINKGGGKFEKSKLCIPLTGLILGFSDETVKGMRTPYFMGDKLEYQ